MRTNHAATPGPIHLIPRAARLLLRLAFQLGGLALGLPGQLARLALGFGLVDADGRLGFIRHRFSERVSGGFAARRAMGGCMCPIQSAGSPAVTPGHGKETSRNEGRSKHTAGFNALDEPVRDGSVDGFGRILHRVDDGLAHGRAGGEANAGRGGEETGCGRDGAGEERHCGEWSGRAGGSVGWIVWAGGRKQDRRSDSGERTGVGGQKA